MDTDGKGLTWNASLGNFGIQQLQGFGKDLRSFLSHEFITPEQISEWMRTRVGRGLGFGEMNAAALPQ